MERRRTRLGRAGGCRCHAVRHWAAVPRLTGRFTTGAVPHDYDQWGDFGLEGWDYSSLLPYFRSIEKALARCRYLARRGGRSRRHGAAASKSVDAPTCSMRRVKWAGPSSRIFLGPQTEGVGVSGSECRSARKTRQRRRCFSSPRARAQESHHQGLLRECCGVVFDNGRAVGAEFVHAGQRQMARARCENNCVGWSDSPSPQTTFYCRASALPMRRLRSASRRSSIFPPSVEDSLINLARASNFSRSCR